MINLPPTTFPAIITESHHEIAGRSSMPISLTDFTTLAAADGTYLTVAGDISVTEPEGVRA